MGGVETHLSDVFRFAEELIGFVGRNLTGPGNVDHGVNGHLNSVDAFCRNDRIRGVLLRWLLPLLASGPSALGSVPSATPLIGLHCICQRPRGEQQAYARQSLRAAPCHYD